MGLAYIVFDMAVNHGPKRAITILQEALGVVADGIFGPKTLRAVRALDEPDKIIREVTEIAEVRNAFYDRIIAKDPSQRRFEEGWSNRSDRVADDALSDIQMLDGSRLIAPRAPIVQPAPAGQKGFAALVSRFFSKRKDDE